MPEDRYVPAAGRRLLTPLFDPLVGLSTRAGRLRPRLIDEALASSPATILDVGCGTGTLVVSLANRSPQARVTGLDGDPAILERAAAKAKDAGTNVELLIGLADAIPLDDGSIDCAISTLVFHHLAPDAKVRALSEIKRVLRPDGRLLIADYGRPPDLVMRIAFLYVQLLDGFANTRQHAAGELPRLLGNAGFDVQTIDRLRTLSGTLELLAATPRRESQQRSSSAERTELAS